MEPMIRGDSGNVGIGTDNPQARLQLNANIGNAAPILRLDGNANKFISFQEGDTVRGGIGYDNGGAGSMRMRPHPPPMAAGALLGGCGDS